MSLAKKLRNFAVAGLVGITGCIGNPYIPKNSYYPIPTEVYQSENTDSPQEALKEDEKSALVYPGGKIILKFDHYLNGELSSEIKLHLKNASGECSGIEIYALEVDNLIKQRIYNSLNHLCSEQKYNIDLSQEIQFSGKKINAIEIRNQGPDAMRLDSIEDLDLLARI